MKCAEKTKMTKAVSLTVIERAATNKRHPVRLWSYECCQCGFWHMTSQKPREKKHWTEQYGMKHQQPRTA